MFLIDNYKLGFQSDSLAPFMSQETINTHHGKHLATYIDNLNKLIEGTSYQNMGLLEIIKDSADKKDSVKVFNNAAQVFNHDFFFKCLANGNSVIPNQKIIQVFGSIEDFKKQFKSAALGVFGSGWVWLVDDNGVLKITTSANADTPVAHNQKPIMCLDVWEHAYYIDYKNRRGDFIDAFLNNLINWDFVNSNLV